MGLVDWDQTVTCLELIRELEFRRAYPTVRLSQLVGGFLGAEIDLPAYAQLNDPAGESYPPSVARDIRAALRLKLLSQDGLDALGGDDVHAALERLKGGES